jgi:hypothetical protein
MQLGEPLTAFMRRIFTSNFTSQHPAHGLAAIDQIRSRSMAIGAQQSL